MKTIAISSGKGGTGKSCLAINLGICLSEMGKRVAILDANFALAGLDVLLGVTPKFHIGHVLLGRMLKSFDDIIIETPVGLKIIPASSGLRCLSALTAKQRNRLKKGLDSLVTKTDFLIIDMEPGLTNTVSYLQELADEVWFVTVSEPTAIVNCYAGIKSLLVDSPSKAVRIVVNQVKDEGEAMAIFKDIQTVTKQFLNRKLFYLGYVRSDANVGESVRIQSPIVLEVPDSPASEDYRKLACSFLNPDESTEFAAWLASQAVPNDWVN